MLVWLLDSPCLGYDALLTVHLINGKDTGVKCLTEFVFQGKLKLCGEKNWQREKNIISPVFGSG